VERHHRDKCRRSRYRAGYRAALVAEEFAIPWTTPQLSEVRALVRDAIRGRLPGADALVPNSVLRVVSDVQGALCHLTLQYVDWLALQLLPDTAETEWLDRHGDIWLVNADGTTGRKLATLAHGLVSFQGTVDGAVIPQYSRLTGGNVSYETMAVITTSVLNPTLGPVRAIDPGSIGNLPGGETLTFSPVIEGVANGAVIETLTGGTDDETDEQLRARILKRIQNPPMGGDKADYEVWALAVPGVTRAWCSPQEMGIGTVSVRFLMDDLRADDEGWPKPDDIVAVANYIDSVRPVTVKDCWVGAPIKQFVNVEIRNLTPDTQEVRAEIEASLRDMLYFKAFPGQEIYAAWINFAIMNAATIESYTLISDQDVLMQSPGHMAVLGTILYD
jgi:uncharacterized phage protein gp47/JayE